MPIKTIHNKCNKFMRFVYRQAYFIEREGKKVGVFHGPRKLADYDPRGNLIASSTKKATV
jgi:hypothetical protein